MYNLKEINEELFQFVTQFDPLIAAVFLLDYKCWGSGTLILDYYHRRIKTIDSRKYYIFMDIFSFIVFMCSVFFDILYMIDQKKENERKLALDGESSNSNKKCFNCILF